MKRTKRHQFYRKNTLMRATLIYETDSEVELRQYLRANPGLEGSIFRTLIEKPGEAPYFHRSRLIKEGAAKPVHKPKRAFIRAAHNNKAKKRI